jgi:hypothetical protein
MPNMSLEQLATYYNGLPQNHAEFWRRQALINNTPDYPTGDHIHHGRTIQMVDQHDWYALFGNEILHPDLVSYAEHSMQCFEQGIPDGGELEVTLLMERDFNRPGRHLAVLLIHLTPHRQFYNGHVVQIEFDEGSFTHRTIERLFDLQTNAIVVQMSEYDVLKYLADEYEMLDLLDTFLHGFNPMRFGINDYGYIVDPQAGNMHIFHNCHVNELECIMRGLPYVIVRDGEGMMLLNAINAARFANDQNRAAVPHHEADAARDDDIIIINNDFLWNNYNLINNENYNLINNENYVINYDENPRVQG